MGANEKYEAAMHGGEHDFGSADPVSANRVRFMSESELDRFIAKIRAEAKVEALNEAANKLEDAVVSPIWCWDKCGDTKCPDDIRVGAATEIQSWLRARANQYKEQS